MQNFINNIEIENYKSIKKQNFDCERINLFIGRPNVGKSNLLEALSLLGKHSGDRFYSDYLNYEEIPNLFYDQNIDKVIKVQTDSSFAFLKHFKLTNDYAFATDFENISDLLKLINNHNHSQQLCTDFINSHLEISAKDKLEFNCLSFDINGGIKNKPGHNFQSKFLSYRFKNINDQKNINPNSLRVENKLLAPFGVNIFKILSTNEKLKKDLTTYLKSYDLEIVYSFKEQIFHIQKKINGVVYETPYSLLADTLQRIIFYNAAIYSNSESVLIFEEPEVNSFPPYIQELAENIVDSESNQFFISTHSPYLLNTIIEKNRDDIGVFIVEYRDHQTIVKKLTGDDISELLDYGTDIFLNIEDFFDNGK